MIAMRRKTKHTGAPKFDATGDGTNGIAHRSRELGKADHDWLC